MDEVLHRFAAGLWAAFGVWVGLIVLAAAVALAVVVGPAWREYLLRAWVRVWAARARRRWADERARALARRVPELIVAADRAARVVSARRSEWEEAAAALEAAWDAFSMADERYRVAVERERSAWQALEESRARLSALRSGVIRAVLETATVALPVPYAAAPARPARPTGVRAAVTSSPG